MQSAECRMQSAECRVEVENRRRFSAFLFEFVWFVNWCLSGCSPLKRCILIRHFVTPSPALGKANAKRNLMQFCSREKDFMATVGSAAQLNQSLPQGRGRGTAVGFPEASVRALGVRTRRWMRMHRLVLQHPYKSKFDTSPQQNAINYANALIFLAVNGII